MKMYKPSLMLLKYLYFGLYLSRMYFKIRNGIIDIIEKIRSKKIKSKVIITMLYSVVVPILTSRNRASKNPNRQLCPN